VTDLVAKLHAALDAEEARLRALPPFPWKLNPDDDTEVYAADDVVVAEAWALSTQQQKRVAEHILAGSPEVGLRMVAAHRKILDLHPATLHDAYNCWMCEPCGDTYPCQNIEALAEARGIEA
jgi:hypothetical protein